MCMGDDGGGYSSPTAAQNQYALDQTNLTPEQRKAKYGDDDNGTFLTRTAARNAATYNTQTSSQSLQNGSTYLG